MIRFLNLKDQITEGVCSFAFYDTVMDEIMDFDDMEVFDTLEEFEQWYSVANTSIPFDRFTSLIPKNYFR